MLPDPLHPAVVHLPIALAVLIPPLALLAVLTIARGLLPARVWLAIALLQGLLVGSAWLAIETGEEQEERVEAVVAERHIEDHEEAAERFLAIAFLGLLATGAGLLPRPWGGRARVGAVAVSCAVLAVGVGVGHSGGELVYTHGAANAYLGSGSDAEKAGAEDVAASKWSARRHEEYDDDDDYDDD